MFVSSHYVVCISVHLGMCSTIKLADNKSLSDNYIRFISNIN